MAIPAKKRAFFLIRGISHRGTYVGWGTSNYSGENIGTPPEIPHGTPGNGWVRPSSVHLLTFPRVPPPFSGESMFGLWRGVKKIGSSWDWGNLTKSNRRKKQVPSQMTGGQLVPTD